MAFAVGQGSARMLAEQTDTPVRIMVTSFQSTVVRNRIAPHASDDDSDDGIGGGGIGNTGTATKTRTKTKKPSMYKVLMLNDDYTPMEFVVMVIEQFFSKSHDEAIQVMLHVHQKGVGICGVFTYEVAETKVTQVMDYARKNEHPLQCTLEKD